MGCNKCFKIGGLIFLALGILYLLVDLKIWDFWNIQWWTAIFLVVGVIHLASGKCPECTAIRTGKKK